MADLRPVPVGKPAPAPSKKGKVLGFFFFAIVVVAGGSMFWHGKIIGEERAKAEGKPVTEAKAVMPWEWSSEQWRSWYGDAKEAGHEAGAAVSEKVKALKAKIAEFRSGSSAQPTATPTTPTTPATPPGTSAPPSNTTAPATPPPATVGLPDGFAEAKQLVDDGSAAWEKNDFKTAKPKLLEAKAKLEPMAAKQPVAPEVTKSLDLAKQLIEDIESR